MVNLDPLAAAEAYNDMQHDPEHWMLQASYGAFKEILGQQWLALNVLLDFELYVEGDGEPYPNSAAMIADVKQKRLLWVLETNRDEMPADHPMLEELPENLKMKHFEIWNDVFRGVHDIMGHVRTDSGFGPIGEQRAWLSHRETMPLVAHLALWCETRGQNAYTNFFGNHASLPLKDRPFAPQKAGVVSLDLV